MTGFSPCLGLSLLDTWLEIDFQKSRRVGGGEGAEALWGRGLALLVRNATLAVGRKFWALSPNGDSVTPKI